MKLFDYQEQCLSHVREQFRQGKRAPLLVAPTGSGKTVMFSAIAKGAMERGKRVIILVHRQELLDQVSATLNEFGVRHGIVDAQHWFTTTHAVQVASVFTLARRMDRAPGADLIIIDEAHHAIGKTTWGKVVERYRSARLLGVTATPLRLSGEGLDDLFDALVVGPSTRDLIARGRLSPVRVYAPSTVDTTGIHTRMGDFVKSELQDALLRPKITGDAIEHYQRLALGRRAAVFCVSLEHAAVITKRATEAGIRALTIDGKMERGVRRQIVRDFQAGYIDWLVTVDIISEGFDCPGIEVGISLRPTQSLGLWLQQCGRCLRTAPGKSHATILDHAGNAHRHGLPDEERDWSLEGLGGSAGKGQRTVSVRVCPACFSAQPGGRPTCKECGHVFAVEPRTVRSEKGDLEELTPEKIAELRAKRAAHAEVGQSKTLESLTNLGRARGYRDPEAWARYVMAGREQKKARKM